MYLLNWNETDCSIEASLGGRITAQEAAVFESEIVELLTGREPGPFAMVIDFSTVSHMEGAVSAILEAVRDAAMFAGASQVTFYARDEDEAAHWTDSRLQPVLEGRELYLAA